MDASSTPPAESAPIEPSSLFERLTNIITSPGETFDEVKNSPVNHANWLVPFLLVCLATAFYTVMAFSQPGVTKGFDDARETAIQKLVSDGKMDQAKADQALAIGSRITKIVAPFGAVIAVAAGLFLMAGAIWLGLKFCTSASLSYAKVIEVCGLALTIDVIQKIIRTWLVCWKENMLVTVSPTFFIQNPDMHSKRDLFLSMADPIDIWWLAVLSLGLSKVARISYGMAAAITFSIWFGFRIIAALLTPAK